MTTKTIKARHIWRTIKRNDKILPLELEFTAKAWGLLTNVKYRGKTYPKNGYEIINQQNTPKVDVPPEAINSDGNDKVHSKNTTKSDSDSNYQAMGGDNEQPTTKGNSPLDRDTSEEESLQSAGVRKRRKK